MLDGHRFIDERSPGGPADSASPDLMSMQLGLSTGVAAELETGWNPDTKSRRGHVQQFAANCHTESLDSKPTVPTFF